MNYYFQDKKEAEVRLLQHKVIRSTTWVCQLKLHLWLSQYRVLVEVFLATIKFQFCRSDNDITPFINEIGVYNFRQETNGICIKMQITWQEGIRFLNDYSSREILRTCWHTEDLVTCKTHTIIHQNETKKTWYK